MFETLAPVVIGIGILVYIALVLLRAKKYGIGFKSAWLYCVLVFPLCIKSIIFEVINFVLTFAKTRTVI